MSYTASNAAKEILKQIATSLSTNGQNVLLAVINNDSSPPSGVIPPLTQGQWDALKAAFNLGNSQAPVDGWLRPAVEGKATSFQLGSEDITGDGSTWFTVASSAWAITPYCPRAMTLIAALCGAQSVAVPLSVRVRFDGNIVASANLPVGVTTSMFTPLMGIVQSAWVSYPLAVQTIDFQVRPDAGIHYFADPSCAVSFSLF